MKIAKPSSIIALALALVVTACASADGGTTTPPEDPTGAADTPDPEQPTEPALERLSVTVGFLPGAAASLPDSIAESQGFFDEVELDVTFINTNSGPGLLNLVLSGDVDVTWAPTTNVLAATNRVVAVAGAVRNYGFQLLRREGFAEESDDLPFPDNMQALPGARIGVSVAGSYAQVVAEEMLRRAGVDPSSVTFVAVGVDQTALGALRSRQIDLLVANPIVAAKAQAQGAGFPLVSTTDIAAMSGFTEAVYATGRNRVETHSDQIARYLAAIERAQQWAHDPQNQEAVAALLAETYSLSEEEATIAGEAYAPDQGGLILEYTLGIDEAGFAGLVELAVTGGLIEQDVAFSDAVRLLEPTQVPA